ncbi:unnamed protein product [Orchesella dallaii]|uniref:Gustatory receptor n=1 Tax=Orchesella dallaii TaxID=48710 RepID=A0ABP1SB41_9HEXA
MLLNEGFLRIYILHLNLLHTVGTFTFKFNPENEKLEICSHPQLRWQNCKWFIHLLFGSMLWIQWVHGAINGMNLSVSCECLLYASLRLVELLTIWTYTKRRESVVELFNLMFQFEKIYIKGNKVTYVKMGKWEKRKNIFLHLAAFFGGSAIAVLYTIQRWFTPCTPVTFAYFILKECRTDVGDLKWSLISNLYLIGIATLSFWLTIDMFNRLVFQIINLSYFPSYWFLHSLKIYRVNLFLPNNDRPQSQYQFFLRLCKYRDLQIFLRFYNCIQQDVAIVAILNAFMIALVISLFALLHIGWEMSFSHWLLNFLTAIDTFLGILLVYGSYAKVCTNSRKIVMELKTRPPKDCFLRKNMALLKRYVKSFPSLKIFFGSVNFLEELTPIVMLHFCLNQLVSLLLLA